MATENSNLSSYRQKAMDVLTRGGRDTTTTGTAYQQNVAKVQAVQQPEWNTRSMLGQIYSIGKRDQAKASEMMSMFRTLQQDKTSKYYNPYSAPTNRAVQNLAAYGVDTSVIDDQFFQKNNYLMDYLIYDGTTNTPTKPGKKASAEQKAAYEYYQIWKSEEATKKAEQQWNALQEELKYWAGRKDLNYSDDEIIGQIDWNKYKALTDMDEKKYAQPPEYNRAIGYSKDALYGVLWGARNPDYNGDIYGAMANSYNGIGNVWQNDPEIKAKRTPGTEEFNPYSLGSVGIDDACVYYNASGFDRNWLNEHQADAFSNDETRKKMYNAVYNAVENTEKATEAVDALNRWIDKKADGWGTEERAQKKLDEALAKGKIIVDGKEYDISILNKIDASIGKKGNAGSGDMVATTGAINYKYDSLWKKIQQIVADNQSKKDGEATLESMNDPAPVADVMTGAQEALMAGTKTDTAAVIRDANEVKAEAKVRRESGKTLAQQAKASDVMVSQEEAAKMLFGSDAGADAIAAATPSSGDTAQKEIIKAQTAKIISTADVLETVMSPNERKYIKNLPGINGTQLTQAFAKAVNGTLMNGPVSGELADPDWAAKMATKKSVDAEKEYLTTCFESLEFRTNYEGIRDNSASAHVKRDEINNLYGEKIRSLEEIPEEKDVVLDEYTGLSIPYVQDSRGMYVLSPNFDMSNPELEYYMSVNGMSQNDLIGMINQQKKELNQNAAMIRRAKEKYPELTEEELAELPTQQEINALNSQIDVWDRYLAENKGAYDDAVKTVDTATTKRNIIGDVTLSQSGYGVDKSISDNIISFVKQFTDYQVPADTSTSLVSELNEYYGGEDAETTRTSITSYLELMDDQIADAQYVLDHYELPALYQQNISGYLEYLGKQKRLYNNYLMTVDDNFAELAAEGEKNYLATHVDYSGSVDAPGFNQMSDFERNLYYAIYESKGSEAADQYYSDIEGNLLAVKQEKLEGYMEKNAKSGFFGRAFNEVISIASAPVDALSSLVYMASTVVGGKENKWLRMPAYASKAASTEVQKEVKNLYGDGLFGQIAAGFWEIINNRGRSAMTALAFGGLFPEGTNDIIHAFPIAFTAAGEAFESALDNGMSMGQAIGLATVNFLAESVTEGIEFGHMSEALNAGSIGAWKEFLKGRIPAAFSEMVGESINDIVERWANTIIAGDKSDQAKEIQAYIDQGYSEQEARTRVYVDEFNNVLHTAIISAISPLGDAVAYGAGQLRSTWHYAQQVDQLRRMGDATTTIRDLRNNDIQFLKSQQELEERELGRELKPFYANETETAKTETEKETAEVVATETEAEETVDEEEYIDLDAEEEEVDEEEYIDLDADEPQPAVLTEEDVGDYDRSILVIMNAEKSDRTTRTAAIAGALNIFDSGAHEITASGVASELISYYGSTDIAAHMVTSLLDGAKKMGYAPFTIKEAIQFAMLTEGECSRVFHSEAYGFATPEIKAKMLVLAHTIDVNANVGKQVETATRKMISLEAQKKIMATTDAGERVEAAEADAVKAREKANDASERLETQKSVEQAQAENLAAAAQETVENPGSKEAADALSHATAQLESESKVTDEYTQSKENAEREQADAEAVAEQTKEKVMTEVREQAEVIAEQTVAEMEQQKAEAEEAARVQAEQQAQAQAEEDQRTGKTQEEQDYELIDKLIDTMGLEEEDADDLKQQLRDRRDQIVNGQADMDGKLTDAQSMLALAALQRKLGIPIMFSDTLGDADGKYADGIIYLNAKKAKDGSLRLGRALLETSVHEITHSLESTRSYEAYDKAVIATLFGEGDSFDQAAYDAAIQDAKVRYFNAVGKELSDTDARKEIVADFAKYHLTDKDVVQRMMDSGLAGKIRNTLHNINQAIKNFFGMLKGEDKTMAENLRKAERLYQKALNERARSAVHPNAEQFSIPQFVQAAGLQFHEGSEGHDMGVYRYVYDENGQKMKDEEGNYLLGEKVEEVTPEMMAQTPIGMLIRKGISDKATRQSALKMFSDLMSMVLQYQDSDLVWEIAGSTLESTFSALKSNSDPQYQTTIDFGTVCAKTQAILDVMSEVMLNRVKEGKTGGLTRQEIMKIYNATHNAGLSVPCPVCYVFSRWMGVPSMLGQMSQFQHDYVATNEDGTINIEETQKRANEYIRNAHEKYGDKKGVAKAKTSIMNQLKSRETNRKALTQEVSDLTKVIENESTDAKTRQEAEKKRDAAQAKLDTVLEEMTVLDQQLGEVEAYNWITQALCLQERNGNSVTNVTDENGDYVIDPDFVITPDEILFDLRRTGEFAKYKKNWKYRTTRGAGMGKAILPYSGASIGDVLYGSPTRRLSGNAWLDMDSKQATLRWARQRAKKQNLVGGQRLQSTSDFRPEWGLDYIMAFLELQAAQSNAQMYTKVAEAVDLFASVGADVNLSIMGYGDGFHEATPEEIEKAKTDKDLADRMGTLVDEDGVEHTYVLDFSDVTGMEYGTAKQKTKDWDNVQMILVGLNDKHIRLAMSNDDIDFIIPWHSSGNSKSVLSQLVASVGEKLSTSSDYTDSQTDQFLSHEEVDEEGKKITVDDRTPKQKMLWEARMKILRGNANKSADKGGLTLEERKAVQDNPFLQNLYHRFYEDKKDKCYGVKLDEKQAKQIFPYEYWDTTSTRETADVNGQRFVAYCEALGLKPRFSQFKDDKGYWKLLIDRRMYDRNGNYREQQKIDATKAKIGALNDEGKLTGSQLPMKTSAKYGPEYQEQMDKAVETAQSMLEDPFGPGLYDDTENEAAEGEEESNEEYSVPSRRKMTDAELDDLLRQAGIKSNEPIHNTREAVSMLGWRTRRTKDGTTIVYDEDGDRIGTMNGNQITVDSGNPKADEYMKALNRVMYAPEDTGAGLEGTNPDASSPLGTAVRAFAADGGMLDKSDELDRFAQTVVKANRTYFPDTNAEQIQRAIQWIRSLKATPNSDGFAEAFQEVMRPSFDYRSADGQARMVAVMAMANAKNDVVAQTALNDAFMRQGTDLGRALQARKLYLLMTPDGRQRALDNMLTRIDDDLNAKGRKHDPLKLSDWIYQAAAVAEDPKDFERVRKAAAAELAEQLPATWGERIVAWRMLSMLSSPKTHIRNAVGNLMNVPVVGAKNKVGALIEIIAQKTGILDKKDRTKTIGLANPEARAFSRDRVKSMQEELQGNGKFKEGSAVQQEKKYFGTRNGPVSKTVGKVLQAWYDANGRALEWEDWLFLKGHYQRALAGFMTARGLKPADMTGKTLEEADAYAIKEAKKATYRDESAVANWLNRIGTQSKNSENSKALSFIQWLINTRLPFKRTPINIAKRGVEYSVAGLGKSIFYDSIHLHQYNEYQRGKLKTLPKGAISPSEWIDRFASGLTGTGIMLAGAFARAAGLARAGFKKDDPDDEIDKLAGDQEYSIKPIKLINNVVTAVGKIFDPDYECELLGEDVSATMDWAVPTSLPFFSGVAMYDYFVNHGISVGGALDLVMEVTDPMMNMSFMSGVNDMLKNNNYSNKDTVWQFLEKTGINFVTSLIPTWAGQIASTVDGRRTTYRAKTSLTGDPDIDKMIQQIGNKLPWLNLGGIQYTNEFGEVPENVIPAFVENIFSPAYLSRVDESDEINELRRVYKADPENNKKIVPSTPKNTIRVNGKDVELTGEEYTELKAYHGSLWRETVNSVIDNPLYQMCTNDDSKADMLNLADEYATQIAKWKMNNDYKVDSWAMNAYNNGTADEEIINKVAQSNKSQYVKAQTDSFADSLYRMDQAGIAKFGEELQSAHANPSDVRERLTSYFKPLYIEALKNEDDDTVEMIEEILSNINDYVELDNEITEYTFGRDFNKWAKSVPGLSNEEADVEDEEDEDENDWLDMNR